MKKSAFFPILVAGAALLLAGCGKSAEFKKLEADLFGSLSSLHDDGMALRNKGSDLSARIDDAIAMYDSMAAKYPKEFAGQSSDDLKAAKEKLANATTSMKEWMAGMKPYDPTMDHSEAMAQLTKAKEGITKVKADFQDAISSATTALEHHKAFAEEMSAKLATTVKKVAKK
jgi:chromosome segregation ATPase